MKVLVTDPVSKTGISILEKAGLDVIYLPESTQIEKCDAAYDVNGLIIRSSTKVDARMIEHAEQLQVVGRAGVGVDNIDIMAATRKGIVVMNTPDVNTISAAEHTVALMLTLSRNTHLGHNTLINGLWSRHELVGTELRNKTVGIIGLGKIGREVIERCRSFGMKIIGYDPFINQDLFSEGNITIMDLDDLVKQSDFISLHIPLNDDTKDLFNFERLMAMKPSAKIINVARGGIINEFDLARALNEEIISGAAIDVFTIEPIKKDNPLLVAKNILLSPHLGASTKEAKEGVSKAICEQVRDYLIDNKLTNALNMPISNLSLLKEIQPFLALGELLGDLIAQLNKEPIENIVIECQGSAEEVRPISLAALKGLLTPKLPDRINYINAEAIAKELGLEVEVRYNNIDSNYHNLISLTVSTAKRIYRLDGSIFDDKKPRLVNILGRKMEVTPKGIMLFIENNDVPGVIGEVGTLLGERNINIAAYLLNRGNPNRKAFAAIRVDNMIGQDDMELLSNLKEVKSVDYVKVNA